MRLLSLLLLIALVACKKDKESKTKSELLVNGSWHVTGYTVEPALDWDGDGTKETEVYPIIDQCIKDDHTTFFPDGTGELDEGPTKCSDGDPQTSPLTWVMDENEQGITIQGIHYLLEKLTETELIVREIEVISADTYTHRVTFAH